MDLTLFLTPTASKISWAFFLMPSLHLVARAAVLLLELVPVTPLWVVAMKSPTVQQRGTRHNDQSVTMGLIEGLQATVDGVQQQYREIDVPEGYVTARHVLFLAAEDADAKAEALRLRIEAGEISFAEAALRFSCCPTRDLNGSLGTFASLSRLGEGTLRGGKTPYDGQAKKAEAFDQLVLSPATPLHTIHTVTSGWGTHLVTVEARGGEVSNPIGQAASLVNQAMGRGAGGGGGGMNAAGAIRGPPGPPAGFGGDSAAPRKGRSPNKGQQKRGRLKAKGRRGATGRK
jgi:hypothetical protein